ncbi:MAG TPA: hypothetical protein PLE18_13875 [Candidatus Sumerlaeota bacterium]|nr:hypothetical protein [Candidatus Sumerlaeota bacterium]
MLIKRYKHRPAEARAALHIIGKVKIGSRDFDHPRQTRDGRQWYPPLKLDHFEVVRTLKSDDDREAFVRDEVVMKAIGSAPDRIQIYLTHNPVMTPAGPDFSGIFEASHLCFKKFAFNHDPQNIKAQKGILRRFCFGDGEFANRLQPDGACARIPCDPATCEYPNASPPSCKPRGRLFFMLRESGISGGVYVFETGSQRAIETFHATLLWFSTQLGGRLTGVPFTIGLYKEKAQRPDGQSTKVWRVYLEGPSVEEMSKYLQRGLASYEIERKLLGQTVPFAGTAQQAIAEIAGPIAAEYEAAIAADEDLEAADDGIEAQNGSQNPERAERVEGSEPKGASIMSTTSMPPTRALSPEPALSERSEPKCPQDDIFSSPLYSPDPEENALANRLGTLINSICNHDGVPFDQVIREVTRKGAKSGVANISQFFMYKGIDDAKHAAAMQRLNDAIVRAAEVAQSF